MTDPWKKERFPHLLFINFYLVLIVCGNRVILEAPLNHLTKTILFKNTKHQQNSNVIPHFHLIISFIIIFIVIFIITFSRFPGTMQ